MSETSVIAVEPQAAGVAEGAAATPRLSGLSIVLPCFDEEANVADAIRYASAAARACAADYEVIVVDDGSQRRDRARRRGVRGTRPRTCASSLHAVNRGYGAALRSGHRAPPRMPWVLLTDADLQFDLASSSASCRLPPTPTCSSATARSAATRSSGDADAAAWNRLVRTLLRASGPRRRLRLQARPRRAARRARR